MAGRECVLPKDAVAGCVTVVVLALCNPVVLSELWCFLSVARF